MKLYVKIYLCFDFKSLSLFWNILFTLKSYCLLKNISGSINRRIWQKLVLMIKIKVMQLSLFVSVWNNEEVLNSALFSCMIIYNKYIEYKISQTLAYTLVSMSAFLPDVYTSGFLHFSLCSVQIIIGLYYVFCPNRYYLQNFSLRKHLIWTMIFNYWTFEYY